MIARKSDSLRAQEVLEAISETREPVGKLSPNPSDSYLSYLPVRARFLSGDTL